MKHTFFHGFSMGSSCEPRFVCTADVRTCRILLAVSSCSQQSHTGSTCTKNLHFTLVSNDLSPLHNTPKTQSEPTEGYGHCK